MKVGTVIYLRNLDFKGRPETDHGGNCQIRIPGLTHDVCALETKEVDSQRHPPPVQHERASRGIKNHGRSGARVRPVVLLV